jgi:hypothetical protein
MASQMAKCRHSASKHSLTQKRYTVSDRELLAVIYAVEKFHTYLSSRFQVVTDHAALEYFKTIPSGRSPCLQRYAIFLSGYCMDLLYRKGSLNVVADAIARLTVKHSDVQLHPVAPHLLSMVIYSQAAPAPVAVTPVIGGKVVIRAEHEAYFMKKFGVATLTNEHRFGIIQIVYINQPNVYVKFVCGKTLTVCIKRLQHIPQGDYLAALSTPTYLPLSPCLSLTETL